MENKEVNIFFYFPISCYKEKKNTSFHIRKIGKNWYDYICNNACGLV